MRRPPRVGEVAAALLAVAVAQAGAVGHLRDQPDRTVTAVRCAQAVPEPSTVLGLDAGLRVRADLPSGGTGSGTVVVQNDGTRPVEVVAVQSVVLAASGTVVLTPPEPPREVGLVLGPRDFTTQDLALELGDCDGQPLPPGFYEVAVVVHVVAAGATRVRSLLTVRRAIVVRP